MRRVSCQERLHLAQPLRQRRTAVPALSIEPKSATVEKLYLQPLLAAAFRGRLERAPHGECVPAALRTTAPPHWCPLEGHSAGEAGVRDEVLRSASPHRRSLSRATQTSHRSKLTQRR